jgi:hypothetical protein
MQRRAFLSHFAALAAALPMSSLSHVATAQTAPSLDAIAEIRKLRINSGTYAGAYQIAPAGQLNWYFINLGLLPIVQYLNAADLDWYVRTYLDCYLNHLEPNNTVRDVVFTGGLPGAAYQLVLSDSDDSYAATTLSLAVRYLRASQNWGWWNANRARLKNIAYANLAVMAKPTGLTSVFQAPRNQSNALGYLMDNCEVYRGLRDFAGLLRERGEATDAAYYDSFASHIGSCIAGNLFDAARGGFKVCDGDAQATTGFYAGTACQVFPQAFGVTEAAGCFDRGWRYLNQYSPNWQDGRYDAYVWSVLGFVAARRGQTVQAQAQMRTLEACFLANRGLVTINELGFYQRTRSILAGRADV